MAGGLTTEEARACLKTATHAAKAGDPAAMLEALFASGFPDGLLHRLMKKWGNRMRREDLEDCVAIAVNSAYEAARSARGMNDIGAWLWKAADNTANDRWTSDLKKRDENFDGYDAIAGEDEVNERERAARDAHDDRVRAEALRLARELLPHIGTGQVIEVMTLVVEAAEQGVPDLPAKSVAESLGISESAARTLMSRGLQRFRRKAEKAGIEMPEEMTEYESYDEDHE